MASTSGVPRSDHRRDDDDDFMDIDTLDYDTEIAFNLQLQEALTASLAPQPPSSAARNDAASVLVRLEQALKDRVHSEIELRRVRDDLARVIHDAKVAREIADIPDDEWEKSGGDFAKPFDGGSSAAEAAAASVESEFRLYFKGLVSEEQVGDRKLVLAGIGVAICDPRDNLVFEVRKPLIGNGLSRNSAQLKALIEGLTAALSLGLKRISFFCDNYPIFQFVNGKWPAKQRKVVNLVNQVKSLRSKFTQCNSRLVPRLEIKFAFKLARDAIESQSLSQMKPAESTTHKNVKETCVICMEDSDVSQMFSVDGCLHRYCYSCMKQHVEVKLLHGILPKCPHEDCKSDLSVDSCAKFLTPKHVDTMRQRIKEASIPATERVYCPYPRCSLLMSKSEVLQHAKKTLMGAVEQSGLRRCMKCHYLFCINCKVPWHRNITCADYKKSNPNPPEEDTKLKFLASSKLWRQCVKCSHMIELLEGCYHMTCRCNYEFCYNCGAEWKDKKATCTCPLWIEDNILHEDDDFDGESDSESEVEFVSEHDGCHYCGAEWKDRKATCSCPLSDEDSSSDGQVDKYFEEEEDDDEDEDYNDDEYQSEDEEEKEVGGHKYENNSEDEYESESGVSEEEVQERQVQEQFLGKDIENQILSDEGEYYGVEEEEDDNNGEDFNNSECQSEDEEENEVGGDEYENEGIVVEDEVQEGQIQEEVLDMDMGDHISSYDDDIYFDVEYEEDEEENYCDFDCCDSDLDF
ncbi:putative transcription factor C2H2 family [Rosa chinensis]|uniref:RBR-type E3 ubiquitin transferase n=1 Tax=Rosa chinensis TaxID=74649 RepID=A0A2P6QHS5_ROSCH|nr:putative transcription factor C2H2 family [Rosa chinensis]